jgi:pimeloyl-ACP methyl ester carboxylesterase
MERGVGIRLVEQGVVPELIETNLGPLEVARAGEGPPVLFVHGTPGGWDSSLAMGRFLVEAGFELIAPARPGYQGTPLLGMEGIDEQADLLAALLDALGHEHAGVVTWSGGGPSGYRLAVRHADRISALVAFAAVSKAYPRPKEKLEERLMMETGFGNWLLRFMATHMPKETVSATLAAEGDLTKEQLKERVAGVMDDERKLGVVLTLAEVAGDYADRRPGVDNDWERFGEIATLELERITSPALVIHGSADTDVPPEHSEFAAEALPDAQRLTLDGGTHLALFVHPDAEAAQAQVIETLRP